MNRLGTFSIQRTGDAQWTGYNSSGVIVARETTRAAAESVVYGLISNTAAAERFGNRKTATADVQVVTLTAFDGTDSFKLTIEGTETAAFVRGTNATAAAIQTALRTATGDNSLTVAGTTDAGPFTVTYAETTAQPLIAVTSVSGCTGAVTVSTHGGVAF